MPSKPPATLRNLSSAPVTAFAWFCCAVLPVFFGLYFFIYFSWHYPARFWWVLLAATPIVVAGLIGLRLVKKLTFHVKLDPERKCLLHGQPLQSRPVNGTERFELHHYGSLRFVRLQFPDGTEVRFIPNLPLYFAIKRHGARQCWKDVVDAS